jgi:hypothetical protein
MPTPSSTAAPLDAELVRRLVTEVVRRLTLSGNEPPGRAVAPGPGATAPTPPTAPAREASATAAGVTLASTVISLAMLEKLPSGTSRVIVAPGAVITPSAREHARDKGLVIDRASAAGGAALSESPLLVAQAECGPTGAARAAAIVRAVPAAAHLPVSGIADVVAQLAVHASRDGARGVLLAGRPALAAALANRSASLRAVTARDPAALATAAAECNANLLVVDPASFPAAGLVRLAARLATRPAGEPPALLASGPAGCGCQGH